MEELRTPDGVRAYVEKRHGELRSALADVKAFAPVHARVWLRRNLASGEPLTAHEEAIVIIERHVSLDVGIAAIRDVALKGSALGVCVVMPLLLMDDLPLNGSMPTPRLEDMRLAFLVEHMDEKIGKRLWTCSITQRDQTAELGDLEEDPGGYEALGGLGELLPRRGMN